MLCSLDMKKSIALFILAALIVASGLHLPVLQSIAWTGMIIHHSKTTTLKNAMAMTFDGKHPCGICRHISKALHSDSKNLKQSAAKPPHADGWFPIVHPLIRALKNSHVTGPFEICFNWTQDPPLTPPPNPHQV